MIILRLNEHRRLPDDVDTKTVYVKMFKNIPKMDLESLLPGTRVKMSLLDLTSQPVFELAGTDDEKPRIGHLAEHQRHCVHEIPLTFVRHQRSHVADDGCVVGQPKLLVDIERRSGGDSAEVDALVDDRRAVGRDPIADEHRLNEGRRTNEAIDLPVLPLRERVASDMEVDSSGSEKAGPYRRAAK